MAEKRRQVLPKVKLEIYEHDNYLCQYCGKDGLESLESWCYTDVEHFNPQLSGDKGNDKENLKTACRICNSLKGKREFKTIQEARAFLMQRRIDKFKEFQNIKRKIRC